MPSPDRPDAPSAPAKRPRGFAAMDPAKRSALAAKGGAARGGVRSFAANHDLASRAGRLGGSSKKKAPADD